ncbi:hypothetical protein [Haladaptatus salinisoli]|uniref:hypothetical protein n=1 Tax=Haladaptatus salinisoli TaxID=2884876 RepID=UPI001D0B617F|nr:hypothetical protein [Haladaptatus salinisoli]
MPGKETIERRIGRRKWLQTLAVTGSALAGGIGTVVAKEKTKLDKADLKRAEKLLGKVENAKNPEQVWKQMSKEDLELIKEAVTIRDVTATTQGADSDGDVGIRATGCKTITTKIVGSSYLGEQWRYFLETDFCYDGDDITSKRYRRWAEVPGVAWSFNGHIGLDEVGGVGSYHYNVWTQGEFESSGVGMEWDHAYPWVEHDVYGDGSWTDDGDHGECNDC